MSPDLRLEDLRAEVSYHRQRLELYRAKRYGPRATSAQRLRELERAYASAVARLDAAAEPKAAPPQAS